MKTLIAMVTVLILMAVISGVLIHRAITAPVPEWYSENTIRGAHAPSETQRITIKARVAQGDLKPMSARIKHVLDQGNATYREWKPHRKFIITTSSRQQAEKLAALHAGRNRLTPDYAQWPSATNRPSLDESGTYRINLQIRSIHPHPNVVRATVASSTMTALLMMTIFVTTLSMAVQRFKMKNGAKTA